MLANLNKNSGFSLLESVVAIFIVSMALVSILAVSQTTIRAQTINKNAIVASMLAQEGLELVRNVRDTNWRSLPPAANWYDNIVHDGTYTIYSKPSDNSIIIDDTPDAISDSGCLLYQDANGYYVHSAAGTATIYRRLITIDNYSSYTTDHYLKVTCLVQAQAPGNVYTYKASTILYDWW